MKIKLLFAAVVVTFLVSQGCEKGNSITTVAIDNNEDSIPPSGVIPPPDITSDFYFLGRIDYSWVALEDSLDGYNNDADSSFNGFCDPNMATYFEGQVSRFTKGVPENSLEIRFYTCLDTGHLPIQRDSMIYESTFHFADSKFLFPGVEIIWTDDNGTEWKTRPGSGRPEVTYFQVQDTVFNPDTLSTFIMTGVVSGSLYNNSDESILLRDGKFRARIGRKQL